ncbi:MAG: twin-arginine translocase subunit TatC [Planctomycetota bacterium]
MVEETAEAVTKVITRKQAGQSSKGLAVMSLGEHLNELRRRLIYALLGLAPIFILGLVFGQQLLNFLIRPVQQALMDAGLPPTLQATGIFETFGTYLLLAVLITVVFGFPWILYQAWRFVAPGLFDAEKRFAHILLPMSVVLTVVGVAFMYKVILPILLTFFVHFTTGIGNQTVETAPVPEGVVLATTPVLAKDPPTPTAGQSWINSELRQWRVALPTEDGSVAVFGTPLIKAAGITQLPRVREYVDQLVGLALAFAGAFQAPVVVLLLGWVGIVDIPMLKKYRKYVLFIVVVVAAAITPPDPFSIFLLAVPLYGLFELGVLLLGVFPRRARVKHADGVNE